MTGRMEGGDCIYLQMEHEMKRRIFVCRTGPWLCLCLVPYVYIYAWRGVGPPVCVCVCVCVCVWEGS